MRHHSNAQKLVQLIAIVAHTIVVTAAMMTLWMMMRLLDDKRQATRSLIAQHYYSITGSSS